jgi:hypothetical protein
MVNDYLKKKYYKLGKGKLMFEVTRKNNRVEIFDGIVSMDKDKHHFNFWGNKEKTAGHGAPISDIKKVVQLKGKKIYPLRKKNPKKRGEPEHIKKAKERWKTEKYEKSPKDKRKESEKEYYKKVEKKEPYSIRKKNPKKRGKK